MTGQTPIWRPTMVVSRGSLADPEALDAFGGFARRLVSESSQVITDLAGS